MTIDIISVQPQMFRGFLEESIVARAVRKGVCRVNVTDLRDFGTGPHRKVDDKPYGGGPGMLMACGPWFAAVESVLAKAPPGGRRPRIVMTSPSGRVFTQALAREFAAEEHLVFMCGRYEGFDARIETLATDIVSLGDFVLTGGELAAAVMADATVRLLPGALSAGSAGDESFTESDGEAALEAPQYTHPEEFRGMKVPEVLLSGDHAKIAAWRRSAARARTAERRPDLV